MGRRRLSYAPRSLMSRAVTLPLWLAVVVLLLAAWAAVDLLVLPSARWVVRRRVRRVLEELSTRLKIRIPPFNLTKREVLISRLIEDAQIDRAAELEARESGVPLTAVRERVRRYAAEIVPGFNAYAYFRIGYGIARSVARR